ncbi:bifunctional 4-hydroxy-2-oxoglutarate aldolase/2-dehydro-3-deoxy-phosphogluconate aldolase [Agrilactobacillus fermenti]|uniref:bifunctional 4-hydroxy-2-oxoglutarate aldolase/2-dehydro-3-deoxy-phosphogluconate aldolase n=1 Tax=Agrilactobacillus fermenti TaxID=2586909 RepID=UPI001E3A383E|nr:bifunctional 4-hydroxy-2-oxoglutarate aldolase/2-dehydro-3-deoxy-phosphogluconate aldolase [Agrilactobacillus fermenti]MCD2256039.1 bifunctional 4-hydroxy-2-oxoglutarate aldolase/2-dehydro-3-deoxy-phosphogluconate aldolase [Agrilactobacillus fermenti]
MADLQKVKVLQRIEDAGVVAVVRGKSVEEAVKISEAAIKGGIAGIELTFTVPHADQAIAQLVEKYGDDKALIGAGTVLDPISARLAIMAGAQYIISPSFNGEVAKLCNLYQVPYLPGCFTITEMQRALEAGCDIIKLFPGSVAGPGAVKAVKAPLPQVNLMPTGGVNLDNLEAWFDAGVIAVGAGSNLVGPGEKGDFDQVTENAKAYLAKIKEIKSKK